MREKARISLSWSHRGRPDEPERFDATLLVAPFPDGLPLGIVMPVISYFFGIYVRMYHDDHPPPHVHVEYQGHEAFVDISSGEILEGHIPRNAARLVRDWCFEHRDELAANWTRAQALEPLERIAGADQ